MKKLLIAVLFTAVTTVSAFAQMSMTDLVKNAQAIADRLGPQLSVIAAVYQANLNKIMDDFYANYDSITEKEMADFVEEKKSHLIRSVYSQNGCEIYKLGVPGYHATLTITGTTIIYEVRTVLSVPVEKTTYSYYKGMYYKNVDMHALLKCTASANAEYADALANMLK